MSKFQIWLSGFLACFFFVFAVDGHWGQASTCLVTALGLGFNANRTSPLPPQVTE